MDGASEAAAGGCAGNRVGTGEVPAYGRKPARGIVTNAASTGIRIDRKRLKKLARRSNAPGLIYLAAWGVALGVGGCAVWWSLGTALVWPAMFVLGIIYLAERGVWR